jgi:UDP-GlcNAc:undecaprenyl-phosphate GlcNAc-1-phosphate transferase
VNLRSPLASACFCRAAGTVEGAIITAVIAFGCAVLVSLFVTLIVRSIANRLGLHDIALNSRKVHVRSVPRLGGVGILAGFYAPIIGLLLVDSGVRRLFAVRPEFVGILWGGLLIAALGLYDDIRGANAITKLIVQFATAGLLYWIGLRVDALSVPFIGTFEIGWAGFPLTLLWMAGITNAMNLIDGLDGLAGGIALVALAALFVLGARHGEGLMMLFTAALAGAVLGFLFFNFNPASIFMGDTGSLFLGFVLAAASTETHRESSTAVMLLVPVVLLGLPIVDTLLSMVRRALRGAPLFSADRGHIHHRLLARGLSHRQSVLVLYGVAMVLAAVALVVADAPDAEALIAVALLGVGGFTALRVVGFLDWSRIDKLLDQRRRNLALRFRVARMGERLRGAAAADAVWREVLDIAPAFGAEHVALDIAPAFGAEHVALDVAPPCLNRVRYRACLGRGGVGLFRARFDILRVQQAAVLELGWADGRQALDRDTEIAVEELCEHLSVAIARIDAGARLGRRRPWFAGARRVPVTHAVHDLAADRAQPQ